MSRQQPIRWTARGVLVGEILGGIVALTVFPALMWAIAKLAGL